MNLPIETTSNADSEVTELNATYAYSYPHKSSYKKLSPPVLLTDIWKEEPVRPISLYVHIPFCEMRCGFCNLFTTAQPLAELQEDYLIALSRQMPMVRQATAGFPIHRMALGGGTPTILTASQLDKLFVQIENVFHAHPRRIPTSVETSPKTIDESKLHVLAQHGVQRISIGVQSFVDAESHHMGRPQDLHTVYKALDLIKEYEFPILNIDLIYGDETQTCDSWAFSVREAMRHQANEIYMYPLYVRPETGLGRAHRRAIEHRRDLYNIGRDIILMQGYEQVSLRCFRKPTIESGELLTYTCQTDGMIGLGCGARSYTSRLHYSTRFAVTSAGVKTILADWLKLNETEMSSATHGIWLSEEEKRRRFIILSLFQADGLDVEAYRTAFNETPIQDYPILNEFINDGHIVAEDGRLKLSAGGLEKSDELAPRLYSHNVRENLKAFVQL